MRLPAPVLHEIALSSEWPSYRSPSLTPTRHPADRDRLLIVAPLAQKQTLEKHRPLLVGIKVEGKRHTKNNCLDGEVCWK